jgi:hypothetical protein
MKVLLIFSVLTLIYLQLTSSKSVDDSDYRGDDIENDANIIDLNESEEEEESEETDTKLFQGDIILDSDQFDYFISDDDDNTTTRTGFISETKRWPKDFNGRVIVPYVIKKNVYSKN